MENRKRNIQMKFYVTEEEKRLIDEKMKQLPIKQYCFCVDCILQISFSSYPISLSFNQSSDTKIRSISISSPCHFYFVLYCFI